MTEIIERFQNYIGANMRDPRASLNLRDLARVFNMNLRICFSDADKKTVDDAQVSLYVNANDDIVKIWIG